MRRVILAALLLGCGSGGGADPDGGGDLPDAEPPSGRERIGYVEVIEDRYVFENTSNPYSRVGALFYDGRPPRFHREVMSEGPCTLRTYTPSLCTPECTDGLCVDTDVCEPWPTLVSAGRLTITGATVAIQIDPQNNYYYSQDPLPENLFDDDATIGATLAGADLPAMSLETGAVAAIAPALDNGKIVVPYPAGEDFVLTWPPAGDGSRVRVTINSNNLGHGNPYLAILECDVADSAGQVALPEAMLDAFPETLAWSACAGSDCPPSTIRRYRRDESPIGEDQAVELVVGTQVSFGVDHLLE